jgi:hypothetical protein
MSFDGGWDKSFSRDPWKDDKPSKKSSSTRPADKKSGSSSSRKDKFKAKSKW